MRRLAAFFTGVLTVASIVALTPTAALAAPSTQTYEFHSAENFGVAANGDRVEVTCEEHPVSPDTGMHVCGSFQVAPKALPDPPSGEFVHMDSAGNVLGGGTWTATKLVNFESYGCGEVLGSELPPNFCGGALKMSVVLDTPIGQFDALLTVFCIVGPNPPNNHDGPEGEGVTLNVPGVINFNHTDTGENIYVLRS